MADISLGAVVGVPVVVPVITGWFNYTPTIVTGGTTTTNLAQYRLVGEDVEVRVIWTNTGAPTATPCKVSMPAGYTGELSSNTQALMGTVAKSYAAYAGVLVPIMSVADTSSIQFGKEYNASGLAATNANDWQTSVSVQSITAKVRATQLVGQATVAYGAGLATNVKSGLVPATATLSKVRATSANGYGSTNTQIRRFTSAIETVGADITYTDSVTLGGLFTINVSGIYSISYTDAFNGASNFGVSKNASSGTTTLAASTQLERVALGTTPAANNTTNVGVTTYLASGDLIRAHGDATPSGASPGYTSFTIQRIV